MPARHDTFGQPDAAVLGRLMTAESMIQVLPDERRIAEFTIPAIRKVPGVSDVGMCIEGTRYNLHRDLQDRCRQCRLAGGNPDPKNNQNEQNDETAIRAVSMSTASMLLGCVIFQLGDPAAYAVYEPFLRNYINFVAICLENQRQKETLLNSNQELQRHREDLEEVVRFRTRELAESEERFSLVMNASQDGLWDWNVATGSVYFSPRWFTMLGYEPNELPSEFETWRSLLHPDDAARSEEKVMAHIKSGNPFEMEFRMRTRTGGWKWVLGRGKAVAWDKSGKATRMVGTHSDITERKHIREALKTSEKRLLRAQSVANVGSWELDLHTKKMWASEEAHRIYGMEMTPDQEMPLSKAQSVVLPAYRPEMDKALEEFLSSGEKYDQYYEIMRQNDSAIRHIHSLAELEYDREGRPCKVIGTIQDISDAKQREMDLCDSEERNRLILHTAMDGFCRVGSKGRILEVNEAYRRMSGYEEHELLAMTIADLEASESPQDVAAHMQAVAEKGSDCFESKHRRKNGSLFDVEVSVQFGPGIESDDRVVFLRDITDRKLAEQLLKENEKRLRAIYENSRDAIGVSIEGILAGGNPAYARLFGYDSMDELIGKPILNLIAPACRDDIAERVKKRGAGLAAPSFYEVNGLKKDGTEFIMEVTASSYKLESQVNTLVILRDITKRKQAEKALRQSEESFRTLFHNSPLGIFRSTPAGRFIEVNKALSNMLGFDSPEQVLEEINDIASQIYVCEEERAPIVEYSLSEPDVAFHVNRYRRRDGTEFVANLYLKAVRDENGDVKNLEGIVEDITLRKQFEEENAIIKEQLQQAQKMEAIGTLAGGIAHDFNNILGAVLGFAEIAHEDSLTGQTDSDDIKEIINAAERAKELVKHILTFSRKNEPKLHPLDVNQACMKAQDLLHRTIPKMISVESDFAKKLPHISADSTQMEQVLLNLCTNAADAMPDGGCLGLATRLVRINKSSQRLYPEMPLGDYVLLTVSDTGCGMARETCEHIFEPFFTTKEIGKGTGLGLSTVYGIIKSHGGFIYCDSDPGKGTTFSIYLPAMAEIPENNPVEPKVEEVATYKGTETILLVDDEKALRAIAKRVLRGSGYRVLEASSGEESLKVYAEQPRPPDLVITDLGMPGMGGRKAMLEILARYPRAKFIVVSGYAAHAEIDAALASGARDYIAKPFKKVELLNKVRNVLSDE